VSRRTTTALVVTAGLAAAEQGRAEAEARCKEATEALQAERGRLAELQVCCCCMLVVLSAANGLHVCCHVFTPSIQLLITAPHTISPASEPAGGR